MPKTLVVDGREQGAMATGELVTDREAVELLGEAAVSGRVWYTRQHLGKHILEKLTEAGFIIMRVLK